MSRYNKLLRLFRLRYNKLLRLFRLSRLSRLVRLLRLTRLAKILPWTTGLFEKLMIMIKFHPGIMQYDYFIFRNRETLESIN